MFGGAQRRFMDRPRPILTESAPRPAWSTLHQIASQAKQLADCNLKKDDKSFLINLAKDTELKFY